MHNFFKNLCHDLKVDMNNKGEEMIVTIKGEKEKLAKLEKKLKAIHELCCCKEDECECC